MKFKFYIGYFLIGIIILPAINYNTFINNTSINSNNNTNQVSSYLVELGSLQNFIEIVGEASLVDEQSLQFNKVGTVTKVNFKAGDQVKKGEIIAEIDNSDALVSIEEARLNLDNAKISLSQLYEGPDESNLKQAQNSIVNSENSLIIAKKEFENLEINQNNSLTKLKENIDTLKKELESSKVTLELTKKELETFIKEKEDSLEDTEISKNSTITDIEDDFRTYILDIEKIIEQTDYVLGITKENRDKNDSYEDYFGAKNTTIKNTAGNLLKESISMYNNIKVELLAYDYSGNREKIENLLNLYLEIFNKLYETTDYTYKSAENSIESVGLLSESDINSIKNNMSSYRNTSLSKISSIKSSLNNLKTLTDIDLVNQSNENTIAQKQESIKSNELSIEKKELDIANAIKSYNETVEDYKISLESKQNDISSKEKSLEIAKLNLEELLEGPTEENIKKAKNNIKQAEIRLENAYKDLTDYILQAPFDGVIRKIDYMPGDNLTNDIDKYVYIENPLLLEITVMLDQIDIVNVNLGNKAIVTFDAYKNIPVNAKISLIDTTPIKTSGVVYYEVKLVLDDEDFDKKILSGMTANIEIITEYKEDILVIKSSSIQNINGKQIVIVERGGNQENIEVETGISSGGMIEIISGLELGDKIIEKEFTLDQKENATNPGLFNIPSGRGNRDFNR